MRKINVALHSSFPAFVAAHAIEVKRDANGVPEWIKVLPRGSFTGRDGRGPYMAEDLPSLISDSVAALAGMDAVIDFDHASDLQQRGLSPAAGWMKEFTERDDGIYARVEWTERGKTALQSREYRYISPVFNFEKDGRITRLLRAGLNNTPNLSQLTALNSTENHHMEALLALLCQILGLAAGSDAVAVHAQLSKLVGEMKSVNSSTLTALLDGAKNSAALRTALCSTLKVDVNAKDDVLTAAIAALAKGSGNPDPAKFVPIEQVTALQAQFNTLKGTIDADKATTAVDQAIKDGKLIPALRDWGLALHAQDAKAFDDFVKAAPAIVNGTVITGAPPAGGGNGLTADEKAICTQLGIKEEDYLAQRKALSTAA